MRRYLLDTGAASDNINRRKGVHLRVAEAIARGDRVGLSAPVLAELFAGVELSASREVNRDRLLRAAGRLPIWPFDRPAAEEHGRIFAALRHLGRPMQQIDMQIAAIAISLGRCTVVTSDSDLSAVPGLDVEDWAAGSNR